MHVSRARRAFHRPELAAVQAGPRCGQSAVARSYTGRKSNKAKKLVYGSTGSAAMGRKMQDFRLAVSSPAPDVQTAITCCDYLRSTARANVQVALELMFGS